MKKYALLAGFLLCLTGLGAKTPKAQDTQAPDGAFWAKGDGTTEVGVIADEATGREIARYDGNQYVCGNDTYWDHTRADAVQDALDCAQAFEDLAKLLSDSPYLSPKADVPEDRQI